MEFAPTPLPFFHKQKIKFSISNIKLSSINHEIKSLHRTTTHILLQKFVSIINNMGCKFLSPKFLLLYYLLI